MNNDWKEALNNGSVWKTAALLLLGAVLVMGGRWVLIGEKGLSREATEQIIQTQTLDRDDVIQLIQTQSPYLRDREILIRSMEEVKSILRDMSIKVATGDIERARFEERIKRIENDISTLKSAIR